MKAFKPSRENAADVALLMFSGVEEGGDEAVLTRYTRLGVETVSEKMAKLPFAETARILPVTRPIGVPEAGRDWNGLAEAEPKLAGLMARAPNSLPM